ncbi:unnamed protein product [Psylliodes chrysocephalus]|uniref:Fatty acyl-CoA reductase n=1 Tax=Psylliodes chrysocephalus TaxID=3402493 RepID=A0A9P0CW07_9CUCU|nr:unnamed protein product [Psylliodes chrysocephala]
MAATETPIQKFYKNTNVFITGGTGFLGKILIEKLLRSTEVNTIFLLIRCKTENDIKSRCEKIFDSEVFNKLKQHNANFKQKIQPVEGDCALSGLGLKSTDRNELINNVNIVFHIAATVKIEGNLKYSFNINVNGTKDVLDLARDMKHLKSIIHVSTAYCNCPYKVIEEKIYDCQMCYEDYKTKIEKCSETEIATITPGLIGKWPNTYTFTKALAESLIKEHATGLPVAIYRPSIVISTYKEPLEGWTENFYGPTGVYAMMMAGLLRLALADLTKDSYCIPVDTCVAGLIATSWDCSIKFEKSSDIPVYNHVPVENPITWGEVDNLVKLNIDQYPLLNSFWTPFLIVTSNITVFSILKIFVHTIPAIISDCVAVFTMNKPSALKKYNQIHRFVIAISNCSTRNWDYSTDNISKLYEKLTIEDKELFPMSVTTIHWLRFMKNYTIGMRRYLFKENDSTLENAKKKYRRFKIVNGVLKCVIVYVFCNLLSSAMRKFT